MMVKKMKTNIYNVCLFGREQLHWLKRSHNVTGTLSTHQEPTLDANYDCNPLNLANYQIYMDELRTISSNKLELVKLCAYAPIRIIFQFTIPDCRIEKYVVLLLLLMGEKKSK